MSKKEIAGEKGRGRDRAREIVISLPDPFKRPDDRMRSDTLTVWIDWKKGLLSSDTVDMITGWCLDRYE